MTETTKQRPPQASQEANKSSIPAEAKNEKVRAATSAESIVEHQTQAEARQALQQNLTADVKEMIEEIIANNQWEGAETLREFLEEIQYLFTTESGGESGEDIDLNLVFQEPEPNNEEEQYNFNLARSFISNKLKAHFNKKYPDLKLDIYYRPLTDFTQGRFVQSESAPKLEEFFGPGFNPHNQEIIVEDTKLFALYFFLTMRPFSNTDGYSNNEVGEVIEQGKDQIELTPESGRAWAQQYAADLIYRWHSSENKNTQEMLSNSSKALIRVMFGYMIHQLSEQDLNNLKQQLIHSFKDSQGKSADEIFTDVLINFDPVTEILQHQGQNLNNLKSASLARESARNPNENIPEKRRKELIHRFTSLALHTASKMGLENRSFNTPDQLTSNTIEFALAALQNECERLQSLPKHFQIVFEAMTPSWDAIKEKAQVITATETNLQEELKNRTGELVFFPIFKPGTTKKNPTLYKTTTSTLTEQTKPQQITDFQSADKRIPGNSFINLEKLMGTESGGGSSSEQTNNYQTHYRFGQPVEAETEIQFYAIKLDLINDLLQHTTNKLLKSQSVDSPAELLIDSLLRHLSTAASLSLVEINKFIPPGDRVETLEDLSKNNPFEAFLKPEKITKMLEVLEQNQNEANKFPTISLVENDSEDSMPLVEDGSTDVSEIFFIKEGSIGINAPNGDSPADDPERLHINTQGPGLSVGEAMIAGAEKRSATLYLRPNSKAYKINIKELLNFSSLDFPVHQLIEGEEDQEKLFARFFLYHIAATQMGRLMQRNQSLQQQG